MSTPAIIATIVTVLMGLILTLPDECRAGRWPKIIITIPLAIVIAESYRHIGLGYFSFFAIALLAHVWKGNVAWFFANVLVNMMTKASDTIAPDFRRAKIECRDGNLKEALFLAEKELNKDPNDVEGLIFVAQLLVADGQFEKALAALARAGVCPHATPAQVLRSQAAAAEVKEVMTVREDFEQKVS